MFAPGAHSGFVFGQEGMPEGSVPALVTVVLNNISLGLGDRVDVKDLHLEVKARRER